MDNAGIAATQVDMLTAIEVATSVLCVIPAAYLADKFGREPFVLATFVFLEDWPRLELLECSGVRRGWDNFLCVHVSTTRRISVAVQAS
jgi:hypothetical protein